MYKKEILFFTLTINSTFISSFTVLKAQPAGIVSPFWKTCTDLALFTKVIMLCSCEVSKFAVFSEAA